MRRLLWVCVLAAVAWGCSGAPQDKVVSRDAAQAPMAAPKQAGAPGGGGPKDQAGGPEKPVERKLIYTAQIDLVVDDFDTAREEMLALVKESGGYVANSDQPSTVGTPRRGTWTVRVPAARFDDFLAAVSRLGELRHSATNSNDITDAYYDLQAHIKNDETREEGLRKLYQSKAATGKLEDLLAIDRELSAVRGRIDAQKGQLQRWDKEVALSTVTVTLQDRRGYVPPVQASFGSSVGQTFSASVDALVAAGKFLVLAVVALAPWLLVLAVVSAPVWYWFRRRRPRRVAG
jgi:hypothetical protein